MSMPRSNNIEVLVTKYLEDILLVHFSAKWSGSAFLMGNILDDLSSHFENKVKLLELDVDQEIELAQKLKVIEIPTILLFNKGKLEGVYRGILSKQRLKAEIDKVISSN